MQKLLLDESSVSWQEVIILKCNTCPYFDYGLGGQYCDKVGGKNLLYGYCTYVYEKIPNQVNNSKQKRRNKRERDQKHINHLIFLAENIQYYPSPVIYTDEIWISRQGYIENPKPYYKRYYQGNHKGNRYSFYKKYANRCVRRYKGEIHNKGNQYRKIFDYWWTVD